MLEQQFVTNTSDVVGRLNSVLPLADRYAGLNSSYKQLYSHIMKHLLSTGAAIAQAEEAVGRKLRPSEVSRYYWARGLDGNAITLDGDLSEAAWGMAEIYVAGGDNIYSFFCRFHCNGWHLHLFGRCH